MVASSFGHLKPDEWRFLFRLEEARLPVAEIASRLGRHRSTTYCELARNHAATGRTPAIAGATLSGYYPVTVQDQALERPALEFLKAARHHRHSAVRSQLDCIASEPHFWVSI